MLGNVIAMASIATASATVALATAADAWTANILPASTSGRLPVAKYQHSTHHAD